MKFGNSWLVGCVLLGCAGADGSDGANGRAGENGETPEITTRAASADDCPEGGSEVEIAIGDESEVIVICDGEQGEDGATGAEGPAGEMGEPGTDGADGAAGPAGMDGENGAPGVDGVDATAGESIGVIEASLYCGALLEGTSIIFNYWARVFTDGSIWSSGTVDDGVFTASNSALFVAEQVGAATAPVTFVFDIQGPGLGGKWDVGLDRTTTTVVITYYDTDVIGGQLSWTLPGSSANCVVNEY